MQPEVIGVRRVVFTMEAMLQVEAAGETHGFKDALLDRDRRG